MTCWRVSETQATQDALHQDTCTEPGVLELKLQEVTAQLASVHNERQKLWEHIADLQLSASDAEQMQVSQRQQLEALCNALEGSEAERTLLQARALRAEQRCDVLLSDMNGVTNATALAAARERELEQLVSEAEAAALQSRSELTRVLERCQELETQLEQARSAGQEGEEQHQKLAKLLECAQEEKQQVDEGERLRVRVLPTRTRPVSCLALALTAHHACALGPEMLLHVKLTRWCNHS